MNATPYSYSDAIHFAADQLIQCATTDRVQKAARLTRLLRTTATSIPHAWCTRTQALLSQQHFEVDEVINALRDDLKADTDYFRYAVLSSILQLALTVREFGCGAQASSANLIS